MLEDKIAAKKEQAFHPTDSPQEVCKNCCGTGLVCGVVPVIDANNCCADFANALCPHCKGKGFVAKGR